jgi:hypothetical protein
MGDVRLKNSTYSALGGSTKTQVPLELGELSIEVNLPELKELIEKLMVPPVIRVEMPNIQIPAPVIHYQAPPIKIPEIKVPQAVTTVHVASPEIPVQVNPTFSPVFNPSIEAKLCLANKHLLVALIAGVYLLLATMLFVIIAPHL